MADTVIPFNEKTTDLPKKEADIERLTGALEAVDKRGKLDPEGAVDELIDYENQKKKTGQILMKVLPVGQRKEIDKKLKTIMEKTVGETPDDPHALYGGDDNGIQDLNVNKAQGGAVSGKAGELLGDTGYGGQPLSNHPQFPPFFILMVFVIVVMYFMFRWVRKFIMGFSTRLFLRLLIFLFGYVLFVFIGKLVIGVDFDSWMMGMI